MKNNTATVILFAFLLKYQRDKTRQPVKRMALSNAHNSHDSTKHRILLAKLL